MDLSWECNHWCLAFLDSHHPSAVSMETEPAESLTVFEFQRPSAAVGFDVTLAEAMYPPQRLADCEQPCMFLTLLRHSNRTLCCPSVCVCTIC